MSAMETLLGLIEKLNEDEKVNEGEYLNLMNALKKVNDDNTRNNPPERPVWNGDERLDRTSALFVQYLKPDAHFYVRNLEYLVCFNACYKAIELNQEVDDMTLGKALCYFSWYRNMSKDEVMEYVLHSNHKFSRKIKGGLIFKALEWRKAYQYVYPERQSIKKTNETTSQKTHIVRVDITSPIQESFNMETKLIRLGGSTTLSRLLNHYIIKKLDVLKPSHINALLTYENFPFYLETSGIDAKTRNQNRKYLYKWNDIEYSITYLTK
jgi:hypothetical protein